MGKNNTRKSLEEVRQYFVDHGCELLENEYINAQTKMRYKCVCGYESVINYNNFRIGKRCGCGRAGVNRYTIDELKVEVEARGFKFVSSEYINNTHFITCICKCGNKRQCEFKSLRRSNGCFKCRDKESALKFDFVKKFFLDRGCELLDNEYKNARTLLNYKCVCGNVSKIVFDSFRIGNRCKDCGSKKLSKRFSGENHPNWNPDRKQAADNLRFRRRCCNLVKNSLNCTGRIKETKTAILLGYNFRQLQEHIKSHPNWDKVKNGKWEVDHIFPIKAFLDYGISDLKIINCLENLQPLSEFDNCSKNAKYDFVEFEKWLISKKVLF